MAGYGWGSGRFPGGGYREGQGRGRNRGYGRDFDETRYGRENRYDWESRYGRGSGYGREFRGPHTVGSTGGYDLVDYPRGAAMDPDERLLAAVRQKLFEDTWLDARKIQVDAEDGVIYLSGSVSSHLESRYAWDDAWETEGVRGVVTRLEVAGPRGNDTSDRHSRDTSDRHPPNISDRHPRESGDPGGGSSHSPD